MIKKTRAQKGGFKDVDVQRADSELREGISPDVLV